MTIRLTARAARRTRRLHLANMVAVVKCADPARGFIFYTVPWPGVTDPPACHPSIRATWDMLGHVVHGCA